MNVLRCTRLAYVFALFLLLVSLLFIFPADSRALSVVPLGDYDNISVLEVSGDFNAFTPAGQVNVTPRQAVAREFYRSHGDDYDFLVFFTGFDVVMPPGALAFYLPVKNDVEGIGQDLFDQTNNYSVDGAFLEQLGGIIDMGPAARHVLEPADPAFDKTLLVLTHEMLHRWGAYVSFMDDGVVSDALLGAGNAHWSFLLDADGSSLYGNHWQDNGDGTFTSIPPEEAQTGSFIGRVLSPLDRYLMGLASKDDVPPLRLLDSPGIDRSRQPAVGVTIPGLVREISIEQIVAAEGERFPAATDAARKFRMAFIYLVAPNTWDPASPVAQQQLAGIKSLQREWSTRFAILSDGSASVQTEFVTPIEVEGNPGLDDYPVNPSLAPSVVKGVDWLLARQNTNGSWQDQTGTAVRDTAAAVAALQPFPAGAAKALTGSAWLSAATAENHDFLARLLLVQTTDNVALLQAAQNSDGGWGAGPGYRSSPLDTALALLALAQNDLSTPVTIDAAINSLHNTQNPDGGWSSGYGDSLIQPTVYALLALDHYRQNPLYTLEPALADGIDWLMARQNGDGGFGNSPSTVYDTALSLRVLKTCGAAPGGTSAAVDYLLAAQSSTGSWQGSVFQTALAVEALYAGQVAVDLTLSSSDIVFTPASVTVVPADLAVTVTVRNLGSIAAGSVEVMLYAGDPALGNLIGQQTVSVPGSGSADAVFTTTVADFGLHPFHVVIDAADLLAESNEWNNSAAKTFAANVPPPTVGFAQSASAGPEAQTSVALAVNLAYPWSEPITVNYSVNAASTALSGGDYSLTAGVLTFAPDETVKNIPLTIVNDAVAEIDKTVVIDLSNLSLGTLDLARHIYTIRDDEAPAVTISAPAAGLIGTATPQLLFSTTGSSVAVKVDGVVVSKVTGETFDPLGEGDHFVEVSATNGLGLVGTARVDFTVDTSLPAVVILSPVGLQTVNTPLLDYTVSDAETVEVRVDGVVAGKTAGQVLDPVSEGNHSVTVTATNAAGRTSSVTETFLVDTTPPQVTIRYPYEGGVIKENNPLLLYDLSEAGTVSVSIDGAPVSQKDGETLDFLTDGEHILRITLTDANGISAHDEISFVIYSGADEPYISRLSIGVNARKAAIDFDDYGNIYIAGHDSNYDIFVRKYNSYGEMIWYSTIAAGDSEWVEGLVVDSEGNSYVAGYTFSSLPGFVNRGLSDCFVVKFDADGNRVWINQFGTPYTDKAYGLAIDDNDNVAVSGMTGGYLFGSFDGSWQFFVAKLDLVTGQFVWGKQFASRTTERYAYLDSGEVTFDNGGNIYLAANTEVDGNSDYMIWKMDANGWYQWSYKSSSTTDEFVYGLGVDALGNLIISGNKVIASANFRFAAKFNSDGLHLWENTYGGTNYDNVATVAVEGNGNFFLSGGWFDVTKIDKDGNQLWNVDAAAYGDTYDIAMDKYRNIYVVGGYSGAYGSFHRLSDPRNPTVEFDAYNVWVNGETASVHGTASNATSVQLGFHHEDLVSDAVFTEPGRWSATLSGFGEGANDISAVAKNAAGFKNWAHAKARVDSIVPVAVIISPASGETFSTKPALSYTATEGKVTVYVNGIAVYKQSGALIDALIPGLNTIRVEAVDLAGNIGFDEIVIYAEGAAVGALPMDLLGSTQYGSSGAETVTAVVADDNGNIYMLGYTTGSFPGSSHFGGKDKFVSKFDSSGSHVATWQLGQLEDESDGGIAVDSAGNMYIAWSAQYTSYKGKTQIQDKKAHVAKVDPSGNVVWQQTYDSSGDDLVRDVALDAAGNIYIAGQTNGSIDRERYGSAGDYFVAKLGNDGAKLWTRLSKEASTDDIKAIDVDAAGNVYAVGHTSYALDGVELPDRVFLVRYDTNGTRTWIEPVVLPANNFTGLAIDVSSQGDFVVAGYSLNQDYFIAKYGPSGAHAWTEISPATNHVSALGVAFDDAGDVLLTGYTSQSFDDNQSLGRVDAFLVKHAATGEKLWSTQFGSAADDYARGLAVLPSGEVFVGGHTNGKVGAMLYGSSDIFLSKFSMAKLPAGPDLTINPLAQTINVTQAMILGTVSADADVSAVVMAPTGSTAVISPVTQNPDGTWSFTVSNLVANADNLLTVSATDAVGTTSRQVALSVDTLPPALSIDPVVSPTSQASQVLSGSVERGALLTVEVNPPATPEGVAVVAAAWSYAATGLSEGDNIFNVTATDGAGNTTTRSVTITYVPPPPLSLAVNPAFIAENEGADISLIITNVAPAGSAVTVEQILDLNQNGVAETGETLVRRFTVTDGAAAGNPNLAVDSDGLADGSIIVSLNAWFANDRYHATGQYVFTARTAMDSDSEGFSVIEAPQPQSLSGVVLASPSLPVSGALVELRDVWGRSYGFAMTDAAGQYRFSVERPGDYLPVPFAPGYAYDRTAAQVVKVSGGQAAVWGLTLVPGTYQVSGKVLDAVTLAGLSGVLVHAESSQFLAQAMTAADGSYSLALPDGNYELMIEARPGDGLASQGYAASSVPQRVIQVDGNLVGQDLLAVKGTSLICGAVSDAAGRGAAGVPVRAYDTQGGDSYAETVSDGQGEYCVMLASGGSWQLALNDGLTYGTRMVGTLAAPVDPNLTIYPIDGWVGGTVSDESVQPVAGLWVEVGHISGAGSAVKTTADGRYLLGLSTEPAGEWSVVVHGEALGYEPLAPEWLAPITSQTLVRDFFLVEVQQPANSIVVTNASYHSKKKTLTVHATSDLGAAAALELAGAGPMSWNGRQARWEKVKTGVTVKPDAVTVYGREGSVTLPVN